MELSIQLRKEMQSDIRTCSNYSSIKGSEQLLDQMIAKYSGIDPSFGKDILRTDTGNLVGKEWDCRPQLIAAAARLNVMLLSSPVDQISKDELEFSDLIDQIPEVQKAFSGNPPTIYTAPIFCEWSEKVKYHIRKLKQDDTITELLHTFDAFNGWADAQIFPKVVAKCRTINEKDKSYVIAEQEKTSTGPTGNKIFVIHGHDTEAKISVARLLENLGLEAVILHEQQDPGDTIIEKLEKHMAKVAFAIVLYTECDLGRAKECDESANRFRARQNVVFEHGLLIGGLGRNRVCALVKGNIEKPGDIDGIVYITMDTAGAWKYQLCKNLRAAGIEADANKIK